MKSVVSSWLLNCSLVVTKHMIIPLYEPECLGVTFHEEYSLLVKKEVLEFT
jgi:hypothetical protein